MRVVLVVASFAIVAASCSGAVDPSDPSVYGTPTISGAALDQLPAGTDDPARGREAPGVIGADFDGEATAIDPASGDATIVLFLAHWCPHCQEEVPVVGQWLATNPLPDGVEFVSVATSTDPARPNFPPAAWLEGEAWPVPVIVDDADGTVARAYGLSAFPFWVFIAPDGTIVQRWAGALEPADLTQIAASLGALP